MFNVMLLLVEVHHRNVDDTLTCWKDIDGVDTSCRTGMETKPLKDDSCLLVDSMSMSYQQILIQVSTCSTVECRIVKYTLQYTAVHCSTHTYTALPQC